MSIKKILIDTSIRFPKATIGITVLFFLALAALTPRLTVDTDPENMLPEDQAARVFHNQVKEEFALHDMIVIGVVNETDPDGVFNPTSLTRVLELTEEIRRIDGVIEHDLLSLATVDNIGQDGPGVVRFEWMLHDPPATRDDALAIRDAARKIPTIHGTLVSEDGRAAAIYVPIEEKNLSHEIATQIETWTDQAVGDEAYYISGLPVAEDTFGFEMFKQMGIAAPAAGLIIFLLMFVFFRSISLITGPMIVAVMTVGSTMGLLIGTGFTVHIMSSMIPIFLMPIAVVDSVHILSEFADLYPKIKDRKKTIEMVMEDLFEPMHFTSLTSAAGFISLALAPIPPVRVFGIFVAIGITLAFLLTVTFIPAYVTLLSEKRIANLAKGAERKHESDGHQDLLGKFLSKVGIGTTTHSKWFLIGISVIIAVSAYGITKIEINDNPVRWFRDGHKIRVADRVLNEHFAGTYNAYLVLGDASTMDLSPIGDKLVADSASLDPGRRDAVREGWESIAQLPSLNAIFDAMEERIDGSSGDEQILWEDALFAVEDLESASKTFETPSVLAYVEDLQNGLITSGRVGKSTSIVDVVKTVHRELREGDPKHFTVPESQGGVAQTLLSYQSSHRPHDLGHFLTPDSRSATIWVQLKSGDNKDMAAVTQHVDDYLEANPLPQNVTLNWAGLTYLNVVWQDEMVGGMSDALLGSFVIVFIMMLVLFRSVWFAALAMLPLSITIAFIYGLIGLAGKDYDMPIAVLSSLTLGLSVDFAIHFLQRIRAVHNETHDWRRTIELMFSEPARAISRNAIVISVGFLPLLASPLGPYNTVGFFLATIMIVSSVVTLVILPSVLHHIRGRAFRAKAPTGQQHELATKAGRPA